MLNRERFLEEIKKKISLENKKILVAVSGGLDSMTLLDLFLEYGVTLGVAHANFQLRGVDADQDETFVGAFCSKRHIPFHSKRFDNRDHSARRKFSIQMAARELRYVWFEKLLDVEGYDTLALAHHLDDSIETFFINLIRGTGIKGLSGIRPIHGKVIRPLLGFTRAEIFSYACAHGIVWREDSSNREDKYLRNSLRHHFLPAFQNLSTDFHEAFRRTMRHLAEEDLLVEKELQQAVAEITVEKTNDPLFWRISCKKLGQFDPLTTYLFKLFSPYGFTNTEDLSRLLNAQSGKKLFSETYRIVKNRNHWLLATKASPDRKIYPITVLDVVKKPIFLSFSESSARDETAAASIDLDKVKLPLYLRIWKKGDYFYPFGMKTTKKLSKYFKDEKFSLLEKEQVWLLVNGDGAIIWIVGRRLDERFKVVEWTKKILNIHLCT
ncbi:MAG: tRNA lysidine(34) synthetase TilS [Flavobacteriales bacterium Tduv]